MATKKKAAKVNSSSAVGRAGRAATPEQVAAKQKAGAAKGATAAKSGFEDKREHGKRQEKLKLPFDRDKVDMLILRLDPAYPHELAGDRKSAEEQGYVLVPEMSDDGTGKDAETKVVMIRSKEATLEKQLAVATQCRKMLYGAAAAGVGVEGAKVRENEFTFAGRQLPTSAKVGQADALDKLMSGSESTD